MTPARWIVLTVRVPSEELTEELAEGLVALGGLALEQDVDRLTTYVPEPRDPDGLLALAADRLAGIAGGAVILGGIMDREGEWWTGLLRPRPGPA